MPKAKNTNPAGRRFDNEGAAKYLSEAIGTDVSPKSIARLDIPFKIILKRRIFEEADLKAWVERKFANTPRRINKPQTREQVEKVIGKVTEKQDAA